MDNKECRDERDPGKDWGNSRGEINQGDPGRQYLPDVFSRRVEAFTDFLQGR
jgi:hypothetical protein